MNSDQLKELVSGYTAYATSEEIAPVAVTEAPASTPFCGFLASFAFSYITSGGPGRR